jgi:short-subunit dehydrogenase
MTQAPSDGKSARNIDGSARPLAVVTGASTGIGLELARQCAANGFDLLVAADESEIAQARSELESDGGLVEAVIADLATVEGVDKLLAAVRGRPIDALLANAGRGLGGAFLDQEFAEIRHVIDTNVTGTVYLVHKVGQEMRSRGHGGILITGSIAGFMPGTYRVRLARRTRRLGRDGHVPDAGRHRGGVLRVRRHDGH